jgi:hypothetical protein
MVNDPTYSPYAVGACLGCRQLFLVVDSGSACQFCGRPPDRTLAFPSLEPVGDDVQVVPPAPAEELLAVIPYTIKCPHCDNDVDLLITDTEISVLPPPAAPPADEAAATEAPLPAAAPQPADTPPPPAMAQDVFGKPIEGPPEPAPTESTAETPGVAAQASGSVGEGPAPASEEPPA